MNYEKIYYQIINKSKDLDRSKGFGQYYEDHHIIPKSLGGSDENSNMVLLTAREHFICHWLLYKMYTGADKNKMAHAWFRMCAKSDNQKRTCTSLQYEFAKKAHSIAVSNFMTGRKLSEKEIENRKKYNPNRRPIIINAHRFESVKEAAEYYNVQPRIIRNYEKGEIPLEYLTDTDYRKVYIYNLKFSKNINHTRGKSNRGKTYDEMYGVDKSNELKDILRNKKLGKPLSEETKLKIGKSKIGKPSWNKGKASSDESKKKLSESRKGVPHNRLRYWIKTPNGDIINIEEHIGLRKWLKETHNTCISTAIKSSLKSNEAVKIGKWKGYIFYAEPR
jgi:hypothetical protein